MQDKYVGDIGDYGKLILLRQLMRSGLSLGIVWCATEGKDEKNNDGSLRSYRRYSGKHCLKHCDPELFEQLGRFEDCTQRKIENLQPLLTNSIFVNESLSNMTRNEWLRKAFEATRQSELVFFDPDNGIGPQSSKKHISLDELKPYWDRMQSLLIYHHLGRKKGGHTNESTEMERTLKDYLKTNRIRWFHFRRGTSRVYYLAMQPAHEAQLCSSIVEDRLNALKCTKAEWGNAVELMV